MQNLGELCEPFSQISVIDTSYVNRENLQPTTYNLQPTTYNLQPQETTPTTILPSSSHRQRCKLQMS